MTEYNGFRIDVIPRRLRDGVIVQDVAVMDGFFKPLWSHTLTGDRADAERTAKRWIDGTDRSTGFTH